MRLFVVLALILSVMTLAACGGSGDDSGQYRRGQSGPYVGGGAGVGF